MVSVLLFQQQCTAVTNQREITVDRTAAHVTSMRLGVLPVNLHLMTPVYGDTVRVQN